MIFLRRIKKYICDFVHKTEILDSDYYVIDKYNTINFISIGYAVHKFGTENDIVTHIYYRIHDRICVNVSVAYDGRIIHILLAKAPMVRVSRNHISQLSYSRNIFTINFTKEIINIKLSFCNVTKVTYKFITYKLAQPLYVNF